MELPEVLIQHIQSFLNEKEVVRTSILSKSWYEAWLTRPDLEFSEHDFRFQSDFMEVVKRTLERYERSKLNIQRFKLVLKYFPDGNSSFMFMGYYSDVYYVANEWIKKAMKLGATDVDVKICPKSIQNFVLPRGVLESEAFAKATYGTIDVQDLKVSCTKLNSLNLCEVCIHGSNNIRDVRLMSSSIQKLVLSKYPCSYSSRLNRERRFILGVNDFHKLKVLSLHFVRISEWRLRELSKSPRLKKLILVCCMGFREIQISSNSLEFIHLEDKEDESRILRIKFDVPQIRKFIFTGCSCVPRLSFKTTSVEWESRISFAWRDASSSWFVEFRKFLSELSSSKIYLDLSIEIYLKYSEDEYMHDNKMVRADLPPPMVEKLSLRMDVSFSILSILIGNLFWSCRPKFITGPMSYFVVKLLCTTLVKEEYDLEKVDVDFSGQIVWTWSRPLSRKTDCSPVQGRWTDAQVYYNGDRGDKFHIIYV